MPRRVATFAVLVLALLSAAAPAAAAPGDLDATFSGDGKATATFASSAFGADLVRLASGTVVVVGDDVSSIALAGFDTAGEPADDFGDGGKTSTALLNAFPRVTSATVDLEGRILVAGEYHPSGDATSQMLLARYDPSGILDPTFDGAPTADDGGDGVIHTPIVGGGTASANDVLVEPDGDIVVAGLSREPGGAGEKLTMVRYNGNGTLDTGFGGDGIARFEEGATTRAQQMVREPSGKIVVVGADISSTNVHSILVQRVTLAGGLDDTFGTGGRVVLSRGDTSGHSILRQSTGRLVIGADANSSAFRFVRLLAGGDVDTTFGGNGDGFTDIEMGGYLAAPFDLLALDDKIIAAGRGYANGVATMGLLRLSAGGSLDTSFGSGGKVLTTFFDGQFAVAQGVIEDPAGDGRILAAGTTADGSTNRFAIARYVTRIPRPVVTTGEAQDVSSTTATLTGTVDPNGSAATYRFQYGTTTAYGTSTPVRDAPGGPVSEVLGGLAASTTYHFRIVATNAGGTVTGPDRTFTTEAPPPGSPPSVSTGDPVAVGPDSATLAGVVNPAGFPTTYRFRYGTTSGYGSETPARDAGDGTAGVERTEVVGGLQPKTVYHYAVVGENANGLRVGEDRTFTTPAFPPLAVTGDATEISGSTAVVGGRVDPRGTPATFRVQYGTSTDYGRETAPQDAGSGTGEVPVSARLDGLLPFREYHYRVVAAGEGGEVFGEDRTFRSDAAAPALLAARVTDASTDGIVLRARANPNGSDSTLCLYVGRTRDEALTRCDPAGVPADRGEQDVTIARGGLAPGTRYYWEAVVRNAKGQSQILSGGFDTLPAPPPPVAKPIVNAGCVLDFVHPTERGGAIHDVHAIATVNPNGRPTRYGLAWKQFAGGAVSRSGGAATQTLDATAPGDYAVHLPVQGWEPLYGAVRFDVTASNDLGSATAGDAFNPPSLLNFRTRIGGCAPGGERPSATTRDIGGTSTLGFETDLRGTLNASGQPTLWKFEYCVRSYCQMDGFSGLTKTGFAADRTDRPVGTKVRTFPGTSYRGRLLALNRAGETRGEWTDWRTPPCNANVCVGTTGVELNVPYDNSTVRVTVTVDPGLVRKASASASARRRVVVGRTTLRKVKAGPRHVTVRLKRSARRKLGRGGRKQVKATVTTVITPPKALGKRVSVKARATIPLRRVKRKKR